MSRIPDIQKVITDFTNSHDSSQDPDSSVGLSVCPHYGEWVAGLDLSADDSAALTAFSALQAEQNSGYERHTSALLDLADLPAGWREAYLWGSNRPVNEEFVYIVKRALYGEVERRLFHNTPKTPREALALAYLVEATTGLEAAWINRNNRQNYLPMGHLEDWWPQYMSIIDSLLSAGDLAALSEIAGSTTETEALSTVTPPERLAALYAQSTVAAANPRLPADLVNEELENDWRLLFHPNAERGKSWSVIQQIIEDGDYEDLGSCMIEFNDTKDYDWFEFSRFAVDSPQAIWLKTKILDWCNDNLDDEGEREEALELMGIEWPAIAPAIFWVNGELFPGSYVSFSNLSDQEKSDLREAEDPLTDPARLAELAASESPYVRGGVAGSPNTPVEVLSALANDQSLGVATQVSQNPNTSEEALTSLASDSDVGVRILVAQNPSTPMELLTTLSGDPDLIVRGAVGSNPSTPMELLVALAGNENSEVRGGVFMNPAVETLIEEAEQSTDPARLAELADSVFPWVRVAAALNPLESKEVSSAHPPSDGDERKTSTNYRLLKEWGDVAGARLLWEQAAEDGNSDAMRNLGVVLEEAGDVAGAQRWFARAEAAEQQ